MQICNHEIILMEYIYTIKYTKLIILLHSGIKGIDLYAFA